MINKYFNKIMVIVVDRRASPLKKSLYPRNILSLTLMALFLMNPSMISAKWKIEDDKDLGGCSVSFEGNIFNL